MNSYTMHNLATARQDEFLAEAEANRRAKLARRGSAANETGGWHPVAWLRHAASSLTSHSTPHAPATHGRR
jgi:hypothetical protein